MTNVRLLLVVWLCTLVPAAARADDGGWYEWLQKMSGPTLMGFGSDVHLVCIDKDARAFNCEKFWVGRRNVDFDRIRHQIDFRFTVFTNVDDSVRAPRSIWALKLMGMYHYRITPQFDIAEGIGFLPVFGDGVQSTSRGVVTPISIGYFPFKNGGAWAKSFFGRFEENYLTGRLSGAELGNPQSTFSTGGEWRFTVIVGFDFRRGLQRGPARP